MSGSGHAPGRKQPWQQVACLARVTIATQGFTEEMLQGAELMQAVGCDKCANGYKGRTGIYEVVRITQSLARCIMEEGNSIEIADAAKREGFNDLRISALRKAAQGLTSLEEANRVTKD